MMNRNLRSYPRRRGMALVLVVVVMAVAAVMGYSMLASSTLQATASSNSVASAIASAQAESGINLAQYYLQNSANAPQLTNGYWAGANNITFKPSGGSAISGSVNVTVVKATSPANTYTVTSVGSSGTIGGGVVTKTITATVKVNTQYLINQTVGSNSAITIPANASIGANPTTNLAIVSNKAVTISMGSTVTGNVDALTLSLLGTLTGTLFSPPSANAGPAAADIHSYSSYTYQGATYYAQPLPSSVLNNTTLAPETGINPLGVYYYNGNVTMQSNVVVNGSLLVQGGKLTVTGTGNTITAASSMPGLIVADSLVMSAGKALTVNGVVWLGQGLTGSGVGSASKLTINGAFFTDTAGITTFTGNLILTYNSAYTNIPDLSSANQTPVSTQITSWTP